MPSWFYFTSDCILESIALTSISPCMQLKPDLRQHKQTNARLLVSLRGCLSAQRLILIVDRTRWEEFQCCRPMLGLMKTWDRRQVVTQTDWWNTSDWQSRNMPLTSMLTGQKEIEEPCGKALVGNRRLGSSLVKLKTACCCWCWRRNLDECQHHGLPADLSWWPIWWVNTFLMCVGFLCICGCVANSSEGYWPNRRNP